MLNLKIKHTTPEGKTYTIRTKEVGICFGVIGQVVARNGRVMAETKVYPSFASEDAIKRGVAMADAIEGAT